MTRQAGQVREVQRLPTRQLRRFGVTVGGVFVLLGFGSAWRGHTIAPLVLWTLGALLVVPGLVAPRVLGPVQRRWMQGATLLGEMNARIILTAMFYLVFAPVGFVLRLVRDPLDRSLRDDRPSNWIRRPPAPVDRASYERQF